MNADAMLTTALAGGRITTTAGLDRRILAAAGQALPTPRAVRNLRPFPAVAATLVVVAGLAALYSRPAAGPQAELDDPSGPAVSDHVVSLGWPSPVGPIELVSEAPWILVVAPRGGEIECVEAEVLEVLKGSRALLGRAIEIRGRDLGASLTLGSARRSVLCIESLPNHADAGPVLVALEPVEGLAAAGLVSARTLFDDGVPLGVRVPFEGPPLGPTNSEEKVAERILGLIVAALSSRDADVRYGAATALRRWSGEVGGDAAELWHRPKLRRLILARTEDPDARVRWTATWMIPRDAGPEVDAILVRRLFDPDRMVRQPALIKLEERGRTDLITPWKAVQDYGLDELSSAVFASRVSAPVSDREIRDQIEALRGGDAWETRSRAAASLGRARLADRVVIALVEAAEHDPHFEVRRRAVIALGQLGDSSDARILAALERAERDVEGRVAVRVAEAWVELEQWERALGLLGRLLAEDDPLVAGQAAEILGDLDDPSSPSRGLELLFEAAADARPVVRGLAAAGLGRRVKKGASPSDLERMLRFLGLLHENDPSPFVREAARGGRKSFGRR